jgi:hypothetical protein
MKAVTLSQKVSRRIEKRSVSLYFLGLLFGVCIAIAMSFLKPERVILNAPISEPALVRHLQAAAIYGLVIKRMR